MLQKPFAVDSSDKPCLWLTYAEDCLKTLYREVRGVTEIELFRSMRLESLTKDAAAAQKRIKLYRATQNSYLGSNEPSGWFHAAWNWTFLFWHAALRKYSTWIRTTSSARGILHVTCQE